MSHRRARSAPQLHVAPPSVSEFLATLAATADALAVGLKAPRGPDCALRVEVDLAPCGSVVVKAWPPSASDWVELGRWTHEPALRAGAATNYPEPIAPPADLRLVHPCPTAIVAGWEPFATRYPGAVQVDSPE